MMPVVPMFHVNAWGMRYAAAMVGCTLVLPGPGLDGASLTQMIDDYKVSVALGVPTIWQGLINAAQQAGSQLQSLSAKCGWWICLPTCDAKAFKEQFNCETIHAWGMTEN